jgi:hypothetical protein
MRLCSNDVGIVPVVLFIVMLKRIRQWPPRLDYSYTCSWPNCDVQSANLRQIESEFLHLMNPMCSLADPGLPDPPSTGRGSGQAQPAPVILAQALDVLVQQFPQA